MPQFFGLLDLAPTLCVAMLFVKADLVTRLATGVGDFETTAVRALEAGGLGALPLCS